MNLLLIALAGLLLPPLLLRGRTLVAWYATDALIWGFLWLAARQLPSFGSDLEVSLAAVVHGSALMFFIANGSNVRWSATRAALLAAAIYAALIPAMTRVPIDGDEPFYLLVTESIVHDFDLDLANQYAAKNTASGRTDLQPQLGDPVGANGEKYSRHPPLLPLLLVPGYLIGGLHGAVAVIALFGVFLVRSTIRLLEEEGIPEATIRALFPFFALAPPVLIYAVRIWPEVPAAFLMVEALRGLRQRSPKRWIVALASMVFLKLRFALVAVGLIGFFFARREMLTAVRKRRVVLLLVLLVAAPLALLWMISGRFLNVHAWTEFLPAHPLDYARGLFGLLLDGAAGLAFQAPFYLLAVFALTRWRETPLAFRAGIAGSLLYLLLLLPRDEWHGGWAPPLRYIVFLTPVLVLGVAAIWERVSAPVIAGIATWTAGLTVYGVTYPWRLFHIANGENRIGEWLSASYQSDFSRLFPSFIRVNTAAAAAVAVLIALLVLARFRLPGQVTVSLAAFVIAAGFSAGVRPASTVHFEDAHVVHEGGELFPKLYAPVRFAYRGGWLLFPDTSLSFLAKEGRWTLHYVSGPGAVIEIDGRVYRLPASDQYRTVEVSIRRGGKATVRCREGQVNLDRMDHERR